MDVIVSMVTANFKNFITPVSPAIIAKQTDQDMNSLIFDLFTWSEETGAWEMLDLKADGDISIVLCSRMVCIVEVFQ